MEINNALNYVWDHITFEFALKFFIIYFFVIWIALIVWVIKDISIRTTNIYFQIISVFIILFLTPLWVFIYLLIRPGRTLYDRYYDEIEDNLDIFHDIVEERKKLLEEKNKWKKDNRKIISDEEISIPEIVNPHKETK